MRKQTFNFYFTCSPQAVYEAMLDPELLPKWRVPDEMIMKVHQFDSQEGGRFRISLSYSDTGTAGKSVENTDTYHGYFKTLIPFKKIVEVLEFETENTDLAGKMVITTNLYSENNGTKVVATHENLPPGVPEDQNEIGWKISFRKLSELLERHM